MNYNNDFWKHENLKYSEAHLRIMKIANIIERITCQRKNEAPLKVLDIGCGPATLRKLLHGVDYYGIDIALQQSNNNNFKEIDIVNNTINFDDKKFDIIVCSGVFEYLGTCYEEKLSEIYKILKSNGTFVMTFSNLRHLRKPWYPYWNNKLYYEDILKILALNYDVKNSYPAYYNYKYEDLKTEWCLKMQMNFNFRIPLIAKYFGCQNIFIAKPKARE